MGHHNNGKINLSAPNMHQFRRAEASKGDAMYSVMADAAVRLCQRHVCRHLAGRPRVYIEGRPVSETAGTNQSAALQRCLLRMRRQRPLCSHPWSSIAVVPTFFSAGLSRRADASRLAIYPVRLLLSRAWDFALRHDKLGSIVSSLHLLIRCFGFWLGIDNYYIKETLSPLIFYMGPFRSNWFN